MICKKCKQEIGSSSPYYMNVQYKTPMRICERCYIVITRGMGGNGWRKIIPDNDCKELQEGISLLKAYIDNL